ncbi:ABC transporter ATP-binding protein [Suipraeoptans intestinalis]
MMIKITDLHKYYGTSKNRVEVLKGLNLELPDGRLICLLGPSGSGKSTLLNILGGIEEIDAGSVQVNGESLEHMTRKELSLYRRRHLGFVFQFYNLVSNLTVKENIEVGAYLSDSPLPLDQLTASLGLKQHLSKYPNQISGGQAQRTSIGRAMIKNPSLLICDEPTGALDYESAKEVLRLLEHLNQTYHTTIIIATHNVQIANMCHLILKLHDGTLQSVLQNDHLISANEVNW